MPSVGTASTGLAAVTKTSAWTATPGSFVSADATNGAFTVTLPANPGNGVTVGVKKTDTSSNIVTVVSGSSATIDNDTSVTLTAYGVGAIFVFDGTNWQIYSTAVTNAAASSGSAGSTSDAYFAPSYTSGYWYDRRAGTPAAGCSISTVTLAATTIYYLPLYLHKAVSISAIGCFINTTPGAGAVVRIGIYKTDGVNSTPQTLITDYGTLNVAGISNVVSSITLGTSQTLPKGYSWLALSVNSVSWGTIGPYIYNMVMAPGQGFATAAVAAAQANYGAGAVGYTATGDVNASALATTASGLTAVYSATTPHIYYKIA